MFEFLKYFKILFSPFKPFKLKWYFGKITIGTPYFLPRKWIPNPNNPGYKKAVPKKFGFDFVRLGWKIKWTHIDYRFEWAPLISFVFYKWQIAVIISAPEQTHYWEAWLYYEHDTNKNKTQKERIRETIENFPLNYIVSEKDNPPKQVNYYFKILKKKYHSEIK